MYSHDYTGSRYDGGVWITGTGSLNVFNNLRCIDGGAIYTDGIHDSDVEFNSFIGGEIGFSNGLAVRFGGRSNTLDGMSIHDPGFGNDPGGGADDCDGIVVHGDYHVIRNCQIYNNFREVPTQHTDAIQWWDYAGYLIIEGCVIGSTKWGGIGNYDYGHIQI